MARQARWARGSVVAGAATGLARSVARSHRISWRRRSSASTRSTIRVSCSTVTGDVLHGPDFFARPVRERIGEMLAVDRNALTNVCRRNVRFRTD